MTTSISASSLTLFASLSGAVSFPMNGPSPPTREVQKNTASLRAKSRSACMRCISTDPTIPRQPTIPTRFTAFPACPICVCQRTEPQKGCTASPERGHHGISHLPGANSAGSSPKNIRGAIPLGEYFLHRDFNTGRDPFLIEAVPEHHRRRQDCRQRIGEVLPRDVRRRSMNRLVQAFALFVERGRRQHADRAGEHGGLVREDVAER